MTLVLATRNAHKVRELAALLAPHELRPLPEEVTLPPETGETFADNALGKARAAAAATGGPAVADDSGIEAAALGGAPGVRSARYAGENATDEENLAKLVREAPAGSGLAYVCAIAYVDPARGVEKVFEGRCTGTLAAEPRGGGGFGYDPAFVPDEHPEPHDGRALAGREGRHQPPRPRRATPADMAGALTPETAVGPVKRRAAALSIASNSLLIVLKFAAGIVTGSVALLAEAMQSIIDLVASVVAYVSVRKADEPADENHPYGHEKIENLAAAIEGVLILVGSAIIAFEASAAADRRRRRRAARLRHRDHRADDRGEPRRVGGPARRARETGSPALEGDAAHLRTDALTSVGVLVGLLLVQITGASWLDPVVALLVAAAILATGVRLLMRSTRVLVDEGLPAEELEVIRAAVVSFGPRGIVGFHKLRARRAGARRLGRHARPVPRRNDARGGARHRARAPGRDPRPARRHRRADPHRAGRPSAARDRDRRPTAARGRRTRRRLALSRPGTLAGMTHSDDTTEQARERGDDRETTGVERPDQRGPRGNQDIETIDVERGVGKLERVLGW